MLTSMIVDTQCYQVRHVSASASSQAWGHGSLCQIRTRIVGNHETQQNITHNAYTGIERVSSANSFCVVFARRSHLQLRGFSRQTGRLKVHAGFACCSQGAWIISVAG